MGKNSSIEWTHHTFNPWWGCEKVSPGCANCYAEVWARRVGQNVWGGDEQRRRFFSDTHWKQPLRWEREANAEGTRRRVFCASMGDVFEPRRELNEARERLWRLIESTPSLDWLLLTKRPENLSPMLPRPLFENVWIGTTVENQAMAQKRIDHLFSVDARVYFLSCEPLLGPLQLEPWLPKLDWVITGGESGAKARPMRADWARSLRDQCVNAGVAFHFKQWGNWRPSESNPREMQRVSKHTAGRTLDGRTWDGYPPPA
jgi:protein gp37